MTALLKKEQESDYLTQGNEYLEQGRIFLALDVLNKAVKINPQCANSYNALAVVHMRKKDTNHAIKSLEKAIKLNPQHIKANMNLASICKKQESYNLALNVLNKAIKVNPKCANSYNALAVVHMEKKDTDHAINLLKKAIELDPQYLKAYINLAIIYQRQKNDDLAINFLNKALKINPQSAKSHAVLAVVYMEKKDTNHAITLLEKAIELDPQYLNAYISLAMAYKGQENYNLAILYHKKALKLDFIVPPVSFDLASIYFGKMRYDKAVKVIYPAIYLALKNKAYKPLISHLFYLLCCLSVSLIKKTKVRWAGMSSFFGDIYSSNNQIKPAMLHYKIALKVNPENFNALYNLGLIYGYHLGKHNKALELFASALKITNNSKKLALVYKGLGLTYKNKTDLFYEQGKYEEAVESCKKAIRYNPKNARLYGTLGCLYGNLKAYDLAMECFEKALEFADEDKDKENYHFSIALTYASKADLFYEQEKYEEAVEAYKKAICYNPKNADIYYDIGCIYRDTLNKPEQALECFRKVLEFDPKNTSTYNDMGCIYDENLNKLEQALECFKKALEFADKDEDKKLYHCNLALTYGKQGKSF